MHVAYCGPLWSVSLSNSSRYGVVWQALLLWIGVAADKPSMSAACLSTLLYLDSFLHCSHGCGRVYVMIWCPASECLSIRLSLPSFIAAVACMRVCHCGLSGWEILIDSGGHFSSSTAAWAIAWCSASYVSCVML